MFNSVLRELDEDPFFTDPFRAHNEHMRQMMRSFSDPFGRDFMPMLSDGRDRAPRAGRQPGNSLAVREDRWDTAFRNPFSMVDNMMAGMRNSMEEMHRNFENLSTDSNTHSFCSSSVMSYSKVGDEPAKVFQASSQTRRAPGGIKETRRAVKDSDSGLEKMAIGHHIHDRGHVIEKKHNQKTGDRELNQDFQNLDESEAEAFDQEWQREVSRFHVSAPVSQLKAPNPRAPQRAAITFSDDWQRQKRQPKNDGKRTRISDGNIKGSGVKQH